MQKALGEYFVQIFWQGLVLGLIAWLCIVLPLPLAVIALVLGLYLFWRLPKDPRTHWKRMFAILMGTLLLGGSISIFGHLGIRLPWLESSAVVEFVADVNAWLLFGLAVVIALADMGGEFLHLKKLASAGRPWGEGMSSHLAAEPPDIGGFSGSGTVSLGLEAGTAPVTLSKLQLKLKGPLYWLRPSTVQYSSDDGSEIWMDGSTALLRPNAKIVIRFAFTVSRGGRSRLLFWWASSRCRMLPCAAALIAQVNGREGPSVSIPVRFEPASATAIGST